jgi:hypothetical protein
MKWLTIAIVSLALLPRESAAKSPCASISDATSRLQCYDAEAKQTAHKPATKSTNPLLSSAEARVRQQLRDPHSAQFSRLRTVTISGRSAVCGSVNAKNAFGGMTGPVPFAWDGTNAYVLSFNAGAGNPTILGPDVWSVSLGSRLRNYDKWCKDH